MKILLISYHHLDQDSVGSLRVRAMEKYLPLNGISTTVLAADDQTEDIIFNGRVILVKDINHRSKDFWGYSWRVTQKLLRLMGFYRGIHSYWFSKTIANSKKIIEFSQPQIIIASYPCIEALEIGLSLSQSYGIPLVVDFRDGRMFEPLEAKLLKTNSFKNYYSRIEKKALETASLIISVSEPITNYFLNKYKNPNLLTLPNGFDDEQVEDLKGCEWGEGLIHIVHTGRISSSREVDTKYRGGLDALSEALKILKNSNSQLILRIKIHFVGRLTPNERHLLADSIENGMVVVWGHLPRANALSFQKKADYLLLITAPDQASLSTGKLFEYLGADKPILALTRGTEAEKIVKTTHSGIIIPPDNPQKIADCLSMLVQNNEYEYAPKREIIDSYSRRNQIALLAIYLKQLNG